MAKPAGGAATAERKDAAPKPSDETAARRAAAAEAEGDLAEGDEGDEVDDGDTSHIRVIGGDGSEGDEKPGQEAKPAPVTAAGEKKPTADETAAAVAPATPPPPPAPARPDAKMVPLSAVTKEREQNRALHTRLMAAQRQVAELMGGMDGEKLAALGLAVAGQPKDKADLYRDEAIGNRMGEEFARHPLATGNPNFAADFEAVLNAHPELEASTKVVGGIPIETAARATWALYVLDQLERMPDAPPAAPAPAAAAAPVAGTPPAAPVAPAVPAPDRVEKAALTPTGAAAGGPAATEEQIENMSDAEWEAHRKTLGLDDDD